MKKKILTEEQKKIVLSELSLIRKRGQRILDLLGEDYLSLAFVNGHFMAHVNNESDFAADMHEMAMEMWNNET